MVLVLVVVVEGRRGRVSLQPWEGLGCLDAPTVLPTRHAWERGVGGGGGRYSWRVFALGILGYRKLFSSVRRLRVLIEKILPDLKIFYGFGLKQVP